MTNKIRLGHLDSIFVLLHYAGGQLLPTFDFVLAKHFVDFGILGEDVVFGQPGVHDLHELETAQLRHHLCFQG